MGRCTGNSGIDFGECGIWFEKKIAGDNGIGDGVVIGVDINDDEFAFRYFYFKMVVLGQAGQTTCRLLGAVAVNWQT